MQPVQKRLVLLGVAIALLLTLALGFHHIANGPYSANEISALLHIAGYADQELLARIRELLALDPGSQTIAAGQLQAYLQQIVGKALPMVFLGGVLVVAACWLAIALILNLWARTRRSNRFGWGLFVALLATTLIVLGPMGMLEKLSESDVEHFSVQAEAITQTEAPLIWLEARLKEESNLIQAMVMSQWLSPQTEFLLFEQEQLLSHLKQLGSRYSDHFLWAGSSDLPVSLQELDGLEFVSVTESITGAEADGLWRLQEPLVSVAGPHATCVMLLPGLSLRSVRQPFSSKDSIMEP